MSSSSSNLVIVIDICRTKEYVICIMNMKYRDLFDDTKYRTFCYLYYRER